MASMRTASGAPTAEARQKHGEPNGSFPIFDHKSAMDAILLRGHAPNPSRIIARARAWAQANGDSAVLAACHNAEQNDKT